MRAFRCLETDVISSLADANCGRACKLALGRPETRRQTWTGEPGPVSTGAHHRGYLRSDTHSTLESFESSVRTSRSVFSSLSVGEREPIVIGRIHLT